MIRVCRGVLVAVLLFSGLGGCAGKKPEAPEAAATAGPVVLKTPWYGYPFQWINSITKLIPKKPKPPEAIPARQIGDIRQVNTENNFVLIDASMSSDIQPGDMLVCLRDQQETAELKLSALRSSSFFIADITSGKPAVEDRVYKK